MASDQTSVDSFEDLFRSEYPRLVAYGTAALGDFDLARDLAQEAMARANADWETVVAASRPGAWLQRVMSNLITDTYRRRAVERRAITRLAQRTERHHVDQSTLVDDEFVRMVEPLPERQRMIVAMHYVGDHSIAQIAETLEIATGTVKALMCPRFRDLGMLESVMPFWCGELSHIRSG